MHINLKCSSVCSDVSVVFLLSAPSSVQGGRPWFIVNNIAQWSVMYIFATDLTIERVETKFDVNSMFKFYYMLTEYIVSSTCSIHFEETLLLIGLYTIAVPIHF